MTLAGMVLLGLLPDARAFPTTQDYAVRVPYRLTDTCHILVRARLNGQGPFHFIVDTGAPALFVSKEVAARLGIRPDRNGWATIDRFELEGGLVLRQVQAKIQTPFQIEGINGLGLAGTTLHGIIGYSVLARHRIELDLTRETMKWTPLDFDPPPPIGLDSQGEAPGGLDTLGTLFKLVGTFLGKKSEQPTVERGFLGLELEDTSAGVQIRRVLAEGPAAKAGLQPGDRITHVAGKPVASRADIDRLTRRMEAGKRTQMRIVRGGRACDVSMQAAEGF